MTNAVSVFLDDKAGAGLGARPALVTPGRSYGYADLLALAGRAGNALLALGLEPEQRVALLLHDGPALAALFLGALRIGAVAVPLNTRLRGEAYRAILADSRARVLVVDATLARELGASLAGLPHLRAVVTEGPLEGFPNVDELFARARPELAPAPVGPDEMAFWLYTSGTTGTPKAAVHLHRDLAACRHYCDEVLGITAEDRVFATSRLFFAYALGCGLLTPLFAGARTFLSPVWPEPAGVAEIMAGFRPTVLFSVPTFYARMLRADLPPQTFGSLRLAVSAGERLPPEIYLAYRERFGVEILDGLGATETVFMVLSNRPGQSRPGSSGTPVPGTEARLLDPDGREVPVGEEGVLWLRTPSASPCYWNRVDVSRRTFVGEWFRTGDVYTRDAGGFYYHRGRADDLFKVAGMWVAPAEIEAVLLSHPDVLDAGVVGGEETSGLVKPIAFVVPRERPATAERLVAELRDLAEKNLAPHQRPRRVHVVDELPRTATGKLQRFRLRERLGAP